MSRNEFDAGHRCPAANNEEVVFTVLIGAPAICPKCHESVEIFFYNSVPSSAQKALRTGLRTSIPDKNQELVLKEEA